MGDRETDKAISSILSNYIRQRDNFRTSVFNAGHGTMGQMMTFNNMVNGYHQQLFSALPSMNLAEMEAFAELANSRLNYMRMMGRRDGD